MYQPTKEKRKEYLPYGRQWIAEDDIQNVVNVLRGDYLTTGPTIEKFEKDFACYIGAKYAVAFSNGTSALHGACFAAGIGKGDEVITSPMTFAASANCALYVGAKPIFADINSKTGNIDPKEIEKKITINTKAIIPVDYTGHPTELDEIIKIAKKHNLIVIEDAAHALGAKYKGNKVGNISDMTMFSLHPVKHITTGEGGIITTNNEYFYQRLLQFRTHGITRNQKLLNENHGPWYYEMQDLGYNYRMTDIQAALGISQLKKLDRFVELRRSIVEKYLNELKDVEEIILPNDTEDEKSSWHLFVIKLNLDLLNGTRKDIYESFLEENIGVNVHYIPVYLHPYYRDLGYSKGICPKAEQFYEQIITLPLFPAMTNEDVEDVILSVKKIIHQYRK